jgi:hypothetical protein
MSNPVYYGEQMCDARYAHGKPCRNKAYFSDGQTRYLCGQHAKKYPLVQKLTINPRKEEHKQAQLVEEKKVIEQSSHENRQHGRLGKVICTKMYMMRAPPTIPGFLKVFPNFKHQHRTDGFGCASLSPKKMGPIEHPQPSLPTALNLENLHQGNKVFPTEADAKHDPLPSFFVTQRNMYLDPKPHRHKPAAQGNVPLYSLWQLPDHTWKRLSYIESRQIYCNYYERTALTDPNFQRLQQYRRQGYNLQICGYDAYDVTQPLETHYLDASRPFGHELVLYSLLVLDNPQQYPWRKHKTEVF